MILIPNSQRGIHPSPGLTVLQGFPDTFVFIMCLQMPPWSFPHLTLINSRPIPLKDHHVLQDCVFLISLN